MAETVRRKLTTVMSADVSGYSRLMDVDEVDTLERLKTYREAMVGFIERHRGRVVNTAGDSLLAEFDSVVEAVQCAAEIQRELGVRNADLDDGRQMLFRIGINLGDVMLEGGDLYGEGVNIAARLQGLAEPGGIYISGTTYDQVHNKLTLGYDFIGEQPVKNIAEEIPVYRVLLDAAGVQVGADAPRASSGPAPRRVEQPFATTQENVIEGKTARRIYNHFNLSLIFGVCGLVAGNFTEGNFFDGPGGKIGGDAVFTEDGTFSGKIGGDVVVAPGVKVKLGGKIAGNLILGPQAVAEVDGKIDGDVINHGGTLRLRGKLEGSERHEPPDAYAGPTSTQSEEVSGSAPTAAHSDDKKPPAPTEGALWVYLSSVLGTLFALTLIAGVIMAYVNRGDGTSWVDSHYRFQIRTFWIGALVALVGGVASLVVVGLIVLTLLPFWLVIRCIRGWRFLAQGVPHPNPASWLIG
jgi:class 3 adenylate cyclase/uncharacterized membrane protein